MPQVMIMVLIDTNLDITIQYNTIQYNINVDITI